MPFVNGEWWEKNYNYVAIALGLLTAAYYIVGRDDTGRVLDALHEYASFIALTGSLYVVAGGIHISIRGRSTPTKNVLLLAAGGIVANLIGTTGASMLLIRPYLRNNRFRLSPYHVIFFIFIVSNVGGALTPIGDPPLFLGYLKGVPFFWITEHALLGWGVAMALLLGIFLAVDRHAFMKIPVARRLEIDAENDAVGVSGLHNLLFLAVVIGAVFIERPLFLREVVMIAAAVASWFTTKQEVHRMNRFTFHPIEEVGWLFVGIFLTMMPALDWLGHNAARLGLEGPSGFYWATGALSGVLDNTPTYLSFLATAMGGEGVNVQNVGDVARFLATHGPEVTAISIGAVFFGAMTYIGNGPNFMVRAIARGQGVRMPGFFGYIGRYSLPILLPVLLIVWLIYFA